MKRKAYSAHAAIIIATSLRASLIRGGWFSTESFLPSLHAETIMVFMAAFHFRAASDEVRVTQDMVQAAWGAWVFGSLSPEEGVPGAWRRRFSQGHLPHVSDNLQPQTFTLNNQESKTKSCMTESEMCSLFVKSLFLWIVHTFFLHI